MGNNSLIATAQKVDPPFQLTASWRQSNSGIDSNDRQYIDNQIRGCQQHLVDSLIGGTLCTWSLLDASSAPLAPGDVYCTAGTSAGTVTRATAGALATAGRALGVAMIACGPGTRFRGAVGGVIPPVVTGLGVGLSGVVRVINARCVYVASPSSSDYLIGGVDLAGNLTIGIGALPVAGPQGVPGLGLSQALTWVALTVDGWVTLYTVTPALATGEVLNIAATVNMGEASPGDANHSALWSRRFFGIQNVGGVLAGPSGETVDENSVPPSVGSSVTAAAARIVIIGTDVYVQAQRPTGVSGLYASATVDFGRGVPGANPAITAVSPNVAGTTVGSPVLITITLNFGGTGATAAHIGATALTSVTVLSDTSVQGYLPAGSYSAGGNDVTVTAPSSPTALSGGFTFANAPTVSAVMPNIGSAAGGWSVAFTGTNFVVGATAFTIAGQACTSVVVTSSTTATAVTPAYSTPNGASTGKDVVATTGAGSGTLSAAYFFLPSNNAFVYCHHGDAGLTVSSWADQTGNGNAWAQASAGVQPALLANFNASGHAGLTFDGTDDYMQMVLASPVANGQMTCVEVAQFTSVTATGTLVMLSGDSDYTHWLECYVGAPSNGFYFSDTLSGAVKESHTALDTAAHVFTSVQHAANVGDIYVDASATTGGTVHTTTNMGQLCTLGACAFQSAPSALTNYGPMKIGFDVAYAGALSSGDIAMVQSICKAVFGTP